MATTQGMQNLASTLKNIANRPKQNAEFNRFVSQTLATLAKLHGSGDVTDAAYSVLAEDIQAIAKAKVSTTVMGAEPPPSESFLKKKSVPNWGVGLGAAALLWSLLRKK